MKKSCRDGQIRLVLSDSDLEAEGVFEVMPMASNKEGGAVKPNLLALSIPVGSFEAEVAIKRRQKR